MHAISLPAVAPDRAIPDCTTDPVPAIARQIALGANFDTVARASLAALGRSLAVDRAVLWRCEPGPTGARLRAVAVWAADGDGLALPAAIAALPVAAEGAVRAWGEDADSPERTAGENPEGNFAGNFAGNSEGDFEGDREAIPGPTARAPWPGDWPARSLLAAPVPGPGDREASASENRAWGWLVAGDGGRSRQWQPDQVALTDALAVQVAIAARCAGPPAPRPTGSPDLAGPALAGPDLSPRDLASADSDRRELDRRELDRRNLGHPELDCPELDCPELDCPELDCPELDCPELEALCALCTRDIADCETLLRVRQDSLQFQLDFARLVADISRRFVNLGNADLDGAIVAALGDIAQFVGADGAHRLTFDAGGDTFSVSHEWIAPGYLPHKPLSQNLPVLDASHGVGRLLRGEALHIPDVAALPDSARHLRQQLQACQIAGLICVPVYNRGQVTGWLDFTRHALPPRKPAGEARPAFDLASESARQLLQLVGETFTQALERQRAEAALRHSEDRFRRAIAVAPFPIAIHAEDGEILQLSRAWIDLSGYGPEEIPTIADWTERVYGDRREVVKAGIDRLYELDGSLDEGEFALTVRSGETRTWEFSTAPLGRLPDGRRAVISMAVDVTERNAVRAELALAKARYDLAVRGSGDGIWDWDIAANRGYQSPRYQALLGFPEVAREVSFEDWLDSIHPDDRDRMRQAVAAHLRDRLPCHVEYRLRRADGSYVWVLGRGQAVWNEAGEPERMAGSIRDITPLKAAEAALRQANRELERRVRDRTAELHRQNQLLEAICNNTDSVFIYVKDRDGRYVLVNRLFEAMLDVPRDSVIGLTDADLFPPAVARAFSENDRRVMAENRSLSFEESACDAAGNRRYFLSVKAPLTDETGEVWGLCGISTDITDRKQAEESLRESYNLLQRTIDAISDFVFVEDLEGRYRWVNAAMTEAFRADCHSLVGKTCDDLFPPEIAASLRANDLRVLESCQSYTTEELVSIGGCPCTVLTSLSPYFDAHGELQGLVGVSKDITDRKTMERELAEREARLRAFVDHVPAAIAMFDRQMRYVAHSQRWLSDYRLPADSNLVGRSHYEVFPEMPDRWKAIHQRCLAGAVAACEADPFPRADGHVDWVRWFIHPWHDADGNVAGIVAFTEVINERREAELKLKALNAELSRSNQELEQFAYVASHDLREPLRKICSFAELLRKDWDERMQVMAAIAAGEASPETLAAIDGDVQRHFGYIVDGAERMQQLVNDLLAYSRVGSRASAKTTVDLAEVAQQAIANLDLAIDEADARITIGPLPRVRANETQMVQVFQNAISNALKFRREGLPPQVTLRADGPAPDAEPPAGARPDLADGTAPAALSCEGGDCAPKVWTIAAIDNGIGIAPQFRDRVFEIFQRLHGRGRYPGTGIGLAICKKIVERHGGRIWAEEAPGGGTALRWTLPALPDATPLEPR